jgi:hypothetical protein
MLLIERHVSVYSEAIIRFNNFQLYETNILHEIEMLDVEISSSMFVRQYTEVRSYEVSGKVWAGGTYFPGYFPKDNDLLIFALDAVHL